MNFDLSQLLNGSARDLVLGEVSKQLGLANDSATGSLLNKGLGMVLGGMASKAMTPSGVGGLFDMLKNTALGSVNPLDMLTGKSTASPEQSGGLLDLGKSLIPSIFGAKADAVTDYMASSAGVSAGSAKSMLALVLPMVISFFKNKISSGMGVSGFASLLGDQAKAFTSELDPAAASALGFANLGDLTSKFAGLSGLASQLEQAGSGVGTKVAAAGAALAAGAGALKSDASAAVGSAKVEADKAITAVKQEADKSSLWKWLIPLAILLAALLGIKSCTTEDVKPVASTTPTVPVTTTTPATPEVQTVSGLGNLSWDISDKDVTVAGTVQNSGIKTSILDNIKALASDRSIIDKLIVDATAGKFSFDNFSGLFGALGKFPSIAGKFSDTSLDLAGLVGSDNAKMDLVNSVKAALGSSFTVNAEGVTVKAPEMAGQATPAEEVDAPVIADMSQANLDLEIQFDSDKATIKPRYYKRLDAFAAFLKENSRKGEIAGHTDASGDAASNQILSEERAQAVREYLISKGVSAEDLTVKGYGQDKPRADNSTPEGRAQNRRIEFNSAQ